MSLLPRTGVCLHCGHDHGTLGMPKLSDFERALLEELEALKRDNAALMEDAARYRWLRNTDPQPARMLDVCNDFLSIIDGKELDEAIDAALAQKEGR